MTDKHLSTLTMKKKKYVCRGCSLGCELKSSITQNQCVQRDIREHGRSNWEEIKVKRHQCRSCDYFEDGNVPWCNLHGIESPAACSEWTERKEY